MYVILFRENGTEVAKYKNVEESISWDGEEDDSDYVIDFLRFNIANEHEKEFPQAFGRYLEE